MPFLLFLLNQYVHIMLLGAIGAGLGIAGSVGSAIFGGSKASKAAKQANRLIEQQQKDNQAWFDRRYNEDYSQTAEAQNLMNYAREQAEKQFKRAEGAAAVAGATDESVARAKQAANEMLSETASNIAAQGTARKDAIEQQYLNTKSALTGQQVANLNQKAQNISAAAGQAAGAFGSLLKPSLDKLFDR